jgi:cytochrome c oxidase subunit 2
VVIDEQDPETNLAVGLAIAVAIFISLFTIGAALWVINPFAGPAPAPAAAALAPSAAAPMPQAAPAATAPLVLLFDVAKVDLPADAPARLQPLAEQAKAGATLAISGFHDASGDAAKNAELAKQRAFAVRDALLAAGVPADRIALQKPQETTGGADPALARRVEVSAAGTR